MTISNNPETTSRRVAAKTSSLQYPEGELLTKSTVLRFVEYRRNSPSDRATDKTTATIHLPLPQEIPENIQVRSGSVDIGNLRNLITEGLGGANVVDKYKETLQTFDGDLPKNIARAVALAPIANDDFRTIGGLISGIVKNPHTTRFFDGVELRSYNLSWNLSARSKTESDTINSIIQTVRERMLPEEDLDGFALQYPDLVYVSFEGEGKEYLPQFYKSFINNINISMSSGEGIVFYTGGAPVNVQINISFVETNILTRNVLRGE